MAMLKHDSLKVKDVGEYEDQRQTATFRPRTQETSRTELEELPRFYKEPKKKVSLGGQVQSPAAPSTAVSATFASCAS